MRSGFFAVTHGGDGNGLPSCLPWGVLVSAAVGVNGS